MSLANPWIIIIFTIRLIIVEAGQQDLRLNRPKIRQIYQACCPIKIAGLFFDTVVKKKWENSRKESRLATRGVRGAIQVSRNDQQQILKATKKLVQMMLQENAIAFEPSEEYKTMMDKMIDNHHNGKTNYTSWETIKKERLE